jgi:hypothetical protein
MSSSSRKAGHSEPEAIMALTIWLGVDLSFWASLGFTTTQHPTQHPPHHYRPPTHPSHTADMAEFLGSQIALVSKSNVRYVGTLHEINSESHTVALEQVTSYGTEGRAGNPAEEIPGSDQVYDYIVFRGSDVKELNIVKPASQLEKKPSPKMPNDPAILGVSHTFPSPMALSLFR